METAFGERETERVRILRSYGILDTRPEERFDRITRLAARTLRVPFAFVTLADADRLWYKSRFGEGIREELLAQVTPQTALCWEVVQADRVLVVDDAAAVPRFAANPLVACEGGVRFYAGVPLKTREGYNLGTLAALDVVPKTLSGEELATLVDLAGVVVEELENTRRARLAEEEAERVRKIEARFANLVRNGSEAIAILDARGNRLYLSPSMSRISGYAPGELQATTPFESVHPEDRDAVQAAFARVAAEGGHVTAEFRAQHRDGSWHWYEARAANLLGDPSVRGIVVNSRDVSDRKRRQARQEKEHRILEMIARRSPLREVLEAACLLVERQVEGASCAVLLLEDGTRLRPVAAPSLPEGFHGAADGVEIGPDANPCAAAAWSRERVVVSDVASWPQGSDWRALALGHGLGSCCATPILLNDGRVGGTFAVYGRRPRALTAEELGQVEVAVHLAGIALESARAEAALRQSEQSFRALAAAASQMHWRMDANWKRIGENGWPEMTGQTHDEAAGDGWAAMLHPDDCAAALSTWQHHFAGLTASEGEVRIRGAGGAYRWFQVRMVPVLSEAGKLLEWIGAAVDIDDRKRAEAALRESEERYRIVVEQTGQIVYDYDLASGRITWRGAVEAITGYAPEAFETFDIERWEEHLHPEDRPAATALLAEAIRERKPFEAGYRFRRADGSYRHINERGILILDGAGCPARMLGRMSDVTDRVRHEEELVRAKEQAEEMARLKDAFLANMSHEIRTPLTSIIGFSEVLAGEGPGNELVRIIHKSGQRLLETLNSVLDLAQLQSGSLRLRPGLIDLRELARDAVELFGHRAAEQGLAIELVRPPAPVMASLDRGAVDRILSNLVGNAVKFTERGRVVVAVGQSRDHAWIRVEDTGVGIGADFLPHLFEEFRQESDGLARRHEGSGLGLTITKRLVEMMGGRIDVESVKGRGTTFVVRFPGAAATAADAPAVAARAVGAPDARRRILVVEDNVENCSLLEHLLSPRYTLALAGGVDEALARAADERFDAVLIDINLGEERTGVHVMRALRATDRYAQAPLVACTAYGLPDDRERFLGEGFDGYVGKPFSRQALLDVLGGLLAGRNGRRTAERRSPLTMSPSPPATRPPGRS